MNFSAHILARSLLALTLCSHALATDLLDNSFTWGYQVLSDRSAWKSDPGYGSDHWSDMALSEDRFPLVAYLDRSRDQPEIHSVEWHDGNQQDTLVATASGYVSSVRVATSGSHSAVAWMEGADAYSSTKFVKWSRLTESGWSAPEVVFSDSTVVFDFKLNADGNPVFACYSPHSGEGYVPKVFVRKWSADGWLESVIKSPTSDWAISDIRLVLAQGVPHVVWREYDAHFSSSDAYLFHARESGGSWTQTPIPGFAIQAFFTGPQGQPALMTGSSYTSGPQLGFFNGGAWTTPASIPAIQTPVLAAATAPDGTIYAAQSGTLTGIGSAAATSTGSPTCHAVSIGADGMLHSLSEDGKLVRCLTRVAADWSEEKLSTYEDGFRLEGLALAPQEKPKVFVAGYSDDVILSQGSLGWTRSNSTLGAFGWSIALAKSGQIRAANIGSYYSYGTPGSLKTEAIPAQSSFLSSSWRHGLALDSQDNPHVVLIRSTNGSDATIVYARKSGTTWTTENVASASGGGTIHTGIALGPDGTPWIIAPSGIYHRTSAGWKLDYAATGMEAGAIRVASDSTVYAVCRQSPGRFYALTGKNGSYQKALLETSSPFNRFPALTLVNDRPVICFPALLDYSLGRNVPIFAERSGNYWRQHYMAPPADHQDYGDNRYAVATSSGQILLVEEKSELKDFSIAQTIVLRSSQVPAPAPSSLLIGQSTTSAGSHRFSVELPSLPIQQPLGLQTSTDLKTWQQVVKFGAPTSTYAGIPGLTARGDGFHTSLMLETPAGENARFVRLAPPN